MSPQKVHHVPVHLRTGNSELDPLLLHHRFQHRLSEMLRSDDSDKIQFLEYWVIIPLTEVVVMFNY